MPNTRFEAFKVSQAIRRSGQKYTFYRSVKNKFGEPSQEKLMVGSINGLYHEENGYVSVIMDDTTRYRTKKQPRILCLFKDVNAINLELNDILVINGKTFEVAAVTNIQEWNIIADISLMEVVSNVSAG